MMQTTHLRALVQALGAPAALALALGACGEAPGSEDVDGGRADAGALDAGDLLDDAGVVTDAGTDCAEGSWRDGDGPCLPWTVCTPGQRVAAEGDANADRTCAACPDGTFSDTENAAACAPWTECDGTLGLIWPGSATADRRCTEPGWVRQLGGPFLDAAWSVDATADGGVVVGGEVNHELYVRAFDATGAERWAHSVYSGGIVYDYVGAVAVDGEGNVYVAGGVSGALPGQSFAGGNQDAFLRKLSASGEEIWTRQFGTGQREAVQGMAIDGAGRIVLVGPTMGSLGGSPAGNQDVFVRVYSPDGAALWTRQFGSPETDSPSNVAVDAAASIYVAGSTSGTLPGAASRGLADGFIRKYAMDGTEQWTRQLGTDQSDEIADIVVGSGFIALAGSTSGEWPGATGRGQRDIFVAVMDETAEEVAWVDQFGSENDEYATAIAADAAGDLYLAGTIGGALPGFTHGGELDGFVRSYGATGAERWTVQLGFADIDQVTDLVASPDGRVHAVGVVTDALPGQTHFGGWDAFVAQLVR